MQWVIIIIVAIVWILSKISNGVSTTNYSATRKKDFNEERDKKYKDRIINSSESLFERNSDIIKTFTEKISSNSGSTTYSSYNTRFSNKTYFFENFTRDCVNEIALAENNFSIRPDTKYLSDWKPTALKEWQDLATEIESVFRNKKSELIEIESAVKAKKKEEERVLAEKERKLRLEKWEREETLKEVERNIKRYKAEFERAKSERKDPTKPKETRKRKERGNICIEDISLILSPDLHSWNELEKELIKQPYKSKPFPLFSLEEKKIDLGSVNLALIEGLNREITEFNRTLEVDVQQGNDVRNFFRELNKGYENNKKEEVIEYFNFVINNISVPPSVPKIWDVDYDPAEGILIAEIKLPDVVHNQVLKEVVLKKETVKKPLTVKETKEMVPNVHPAIMLKIAYEIFRNDDAGLLKLLVLNGWVEFDDPTTGNLTRTYTASLASTKEQITQLKLSKLDPISAFAGLKGKSAGKLIDIIPVSPMMSLNKKDKRFIETKEVLGNLSNQTNLASMDWQEFENLIAELFQREFSEEGTEIKLTQSSRDKGVDAIVFNPDPIRGGKYVIQAKRYTNTVDVSAVRDLVAVVQHEGASRGILVTTSTFGADAYAFVQNKPITLLDGSKLLGLLEKHGYTFRINLAEARKLYPSSHKY